MLQGSFKIVSREFQGCFEGVLRVFQGSFKGILRKIQGRFKEATWVFFEVQRGKEISIVF